MRQILLICLFTIAGKRVENLNSRQVTNGRRAKPDHDSRKQWQTTATDHSGRSRWKMTSADKPDLHQNKDARQEK